MNWNPKLRKVTMVLKLERVDGSTEECTFAGEDCECSWEKGIKRTYNPTKMQYEIEYNGHERVALKMWKGCSSFDSFVKEAMVE